MAKRNNENNQMNMFTRVRGNKLHTWLLFFWRKEAHEGYEGERE